MSSQQQQQQHSLIPASPDTTAPREASVRRLFLSLVLVLFSLLLFRMDPDYGSGLERTRGPRWRVGGDESGIASTSPWDRHVRSATLPVSCMCAVRPMALSQAPHHPLRISSPCVYRPSARIEDSADVRSDDITQVDSGPILSAWHSI